MVSPIYYVYY